MENIYKCDNSWFLCKKFEMFFFWQGISPPKAEQPLQGMKLQEKVEDK